jgi:hypothetical protein
MKIFTLVVLSSITVLSSCSFRAERKAGINRRILELRQRIEDRTAAKESCNQFLDSAMIAFQKDSLKRTDKNPEYFIHFLMLSGRFRIG